MAQFMGGVRGNREEVTRLGSKASGLNAWAHGWNVGADIYAHHDSERDRDCVTIYLDGGSNGAHSSTRLGTFTEEMSAEAIAVELVTVAAGILRSKYNEPSAEKLSDRLLKVARAIEKAAV